MEHGFERGLDGYFAHVSGLSKRQVERVQALERLILWLILV